MVKKTVLIFLVCILKTTALAEMCLKVTSESPVYGVLEKKVKAFLDSALLEKNIVNQADLTLSKLLGAKSKIALNWVDSRQKLGKNEDEIILEWRSYYLQNFMLSKFPSSIDSETKYFSKLLLDIDKEVFSNDQSQRIKKIFHEARELSLKTISELDLTEVDKKQITKRISSINLIWFGDLIKSKKEFNPLEFLKWGVSYHPVKNGIQIGLEVFKYPNDINLLTVFIHEIGHSFDSCRWKAFLNGKWPFEEVGSCLRSNDSAKAKLRDDGPLDVLIKSGEISSDLGAGLKYNSTCTNSKYPPIGVQADQLPETFSDWFSAEVLSRRAGELTGFRDDLCADKKLNAGSSYLPNEQRLKNIYLANLNLVKKLKLKETRDKKPVTYCSFLRIKDAAK